MQVSGIQALSLLVYESAHVRKCACAAWLPLCLFCELFLDTSHTDAIAGAVASVYRPQSGMPVTP